MEGGRGRTGVSSGQRCLRFPRPELTRCHCVSCKTGNANVACSQETPPRSCVTSTYTNTHTPPNACRCERAWSQLRAAAGPSCEDVGPGVPRFQWEPLDMAAAARNKMSPLLHILFHAPSKLRFQENSLAWMWSLGFPRDESGHACSHRSAVPTSGSRPCARCHGNRHLFASRALGRGTVAHRRGARGGESLSHICSSGAAERV